MKPLSWASVSPYAIIKDGNYFSGRVMDVLVRDKTLILATNFGGIWTVDTSKPVLEGFTSVCLTDDWDDPDVYSLAQGPDNSAQVFAGCSKTLQFIKLNDVNAIDHQAVLTLPVADPKEIYRIVVQKEARRIWLATGAGLWWSSIPANPADSGDYTWAKASGLPGDKISGLCRAASGDIHVAMWGDGSATSANFGIFKGHFQGGAWSFTQSKLHWNDGLDKHSVTRISLASCDDKPSAAFAVVAFPLPPGAKGPDFRGLLQYDAAADQWNDVLNQSFFAGAARAAQPWGQGTFNNCIAVAPDNAGIVAFGWQMGTFVFSNGTAKLLADDKLHHDVHGLLFSRVANGQHTLYIGSDGGIATVSAPAETHPVANDKLNVFLPTLLFKDDLRQAYATFDTSPMVEGLMAGGLQDNGCKWFKTDTSKYHPWQQIEKNDGGTNTFLANGVLLSRESNKSSRFSSFVWNAVINNFNTGVPIDGEVDVDDDPSMEVCTAIPLPTFTNSKQQLMHALSAGVQKTDAGGTKAGDHILMGLFAASGSSTFKWKVIGVMPSLVTAASSVDGHSVFVGTEDGKTYLLNPGAFLSKQAVFFSEMALPASFSGGSIFQFDLMKAPVVFALYVKRNASAKATKGMLLVYDGSLWKEIGTPVDEVIYSIAADWDIQQNVLDPEDKRLFFITDNAVYQGVQQAGGIGFQTVFDWEVANDQLPLRPHGSHLRTGWDGGKLYLYMSSYGRSVYRAELRETFTLPHLPH